MIKKPTKVAITALPTGVMGLDLVLGGGIPEYSLNLIAGSLGTGKTTLAQQIAFTNATAERQALVFTALGEPLLKMLRYQQQFSFFDVGKIDRSVRYVGLTDVVLGRDLDGLLDAIVGEVERASPGLVVIDSFRALVGARGAASHPETELHGFMQRLAVALMGWEATTFLVGEYAEEDMLGNPVFAVADGVLLTQQSIEQNSVVRKLQVLKMRGQAPMPGLHTFRVGADGVAVYPRTPVPVHVSGLLPSHERLTSGVPALDDMLHGGFLVGDSVLVAGPAGTGKTLLATQFIAAGVARGEHGVIAVFEEQAERYLDRAARAGIDLRAMVETDSLRIVYLRSLDLSVDEMLHDIRVLAEQIDAKRVVIDSISGFELAVAPTFRMEFRETFYRMIGTLSTVGITTLMTVEVVESFTDLRFSQFAVSFLVDDVILERYVELDGQLERVITVVKMRGSDHSHAIHRYEINARGIHIGRPLRGYSGILTGMPGRVKQPRPRPAHHGHDEAEVRALRALEALGQATAGEIAARASIEGRPLRRALGRLIELDYAVRARAGRRTLYRPAARPLLR